MSTNSSNLFYEICSKVSDKTYFQELMLKQQSSFDIMPYKINKLNSQTAFKIYNLSKFKYQISGTLKPNSLIWYQNQRKLFIWFIVCYFYQLKIEDPKDNSIDWELVSQSFFGKNISLLKFQLLNILKQKLRIAWSQQEDQLLCAAVLFAGQGNWNDISKYLYLNSGQTIFKSPKHCRQRWLNHLDQNKNRGKWTDQQDYKLLTFVKKQGKKWSRLSQYLNHTRTQHMVKNRYNSLMTKIRKNKKQKQIHTINKILRHLEAQSRTISFDKENNFNATQLISSQEIIQQKRHQIQIEDNKIEDIEYLQKQISTQNKQQNQNNLIGNLCQNYLTNFKPLTEVQPMPMHNLFFNIFFPNNTFGEPPVILCYNMLPLNQYQNQTTQNHFPIPNQSQQKSSDSSKLSISFKTKPVFIIQQKYFPN